MENYHLPVMLSECIDALRVEKDKLYFDGTLGGGGHSGEMLRLGGRLIATDKDLEAIRHCENLFSEHKEYAGRYMLINSDFKKFKEVFEESGTDIIDGAILDLGLSSHQIDNRERGFSYIADARLDMRMDRNEKKSALSVINEYAEEDLAKILFTYGEERYARKIARNIAVARKMGTIETTGQLAEIVKRSVPAFSEGGHPAKRTFQAIRIEVNGELDGLSEAVTGIFRKLSTGGRLCVISFHSLEDRIVKQAFRELTTDCICDKSLPICVCGHKAEGKSIGNKIRASEAEQQTNSRSRSATLRIIEKK